MERLRIGGVPEHFNLPIHIGIEAGAFHAKGIELIWRDYPGGTGDMTAALRSGDIDICILLTEGIVSDILKGNPSKIISGYVKTPLTWGIHVTPGARIDKEVFFKQKMAISRWGSGSHLMPIVHAVQEDYTIEQSQFVVVGNLNGGIEALKNRDADLFYWEKYTSKPYLKQGLMERIGEFYSPWPCFLIAARNKWIESKPEVITTFLNVVHRYTKQFMELNEAPKIVSERYKIDIKDAERWFHSTEWATDGWVSNKMLNGVLFLLKEAGITTSEAGDTNLIWERNKTP